MFPYPLDSLQRRSVRFSQGPRPKSETFCRTKPLRTGGFLKGECIWRAGARHSTPSLKRLFTPFLAAQKGGLRRTCPQGGQPIRDDSVLKSMFPDPLGSLQRRRNRVRQGPDPNPQLPACLFVSKKQNSPAAWSSRGKTSYAFNSRADQSRWDRASSSCPSVLPEDLPPPGHSSCPCGSHRGNNRWFPPRPHFSEPGAF